MFKKLARCINHFYSLDLDWETGLVIPKSQLTTKDDRRRTKTMSKDDFDSIMDKAKASGSKAAIAFELAARFGLRPAEAARIKAGDIHLEHSGKRGFGQISFTEMGRTRNIAIMTDDDRDFAQDVTEGKNPEDLLVGIKPEAIDKRLNRAMQSLYIRDKYPNVGMHSIRRLYAQKCWDEYRNEGYSVKETIVLVNKQLGLGDTRNRQLLSCYVDNMW